MLVGAVHKLLLSGEHRPESDASVKRADVSRPAYRDAFAVVAGNFIIRGKKFNYKRIVFGNIKRLVV